MTSNRQTRPRGTSPDHSPDTARSEQRFHLLDLFRAAAALAVVLYHLVEAKHTPGLAATFGTYAAVAENGYLGVAVFFVLSGFVIAHSLYRQRVDAAYVARFVAMRSVRLDPPYWAAILVAIASAYTSALVVGGKSLPTYSWQQIASHFVYLQDILGYSQISAVFWTLCLEFQFYVIYAILVCAISSVAPSRAWTGYLVAAVAVVSLAWPTGLAPPVPTGFFPTLWYGFLSGSFCYWAWRHPSLAPAFAGFLACLAAAAWLQDDRFAATCTASAAAIYALAVTEYLARPITRPIGFLATISFSIYLIHNPVTGFTVRLAYALVGRGLAAEVLALLFVIAANVLAAGIFWYLIERPCARLAGRMKRSPQSSARHESCLTMNNNADNAMLDVLGSRSHLHAEGAAAWDASDSLLAWLSAELRPGMRTLETGAGRSTLAFAEAGCAHDVVTPCGSEVAAIQAEGSARRIALNGVQFHHGFSQDVLPRFNSSETLDVAFIDGGHGFPIPAVDFMYIAPLLKVGGALLIDDVDLWTGDMVVQVLKRDPAWRLETMLSGRTAVFRKLAPFVAHEWTQQAYVRRKSLWPQTRRKLVNGLRLLAAGKLGTIAEKIANERRLAQVAQKDA